MTASCQNSVHSYLPSQGRNHSLPMLQIVVPPLMVMTPTQSISTIPIKTLSPRIMNSKNKIINRNKIKEKKKTSYLHHWPQDDNTRTRVMQALTDRF